MQEQYFADENDFLKYALLRRIVPAGEQLSICWMLVPDDGGVDGRKLAYLRRPDRYREIDPELFDLLSAAVDAGRRELAVIENSGLLGDCAFQGEYVPTSVEDREEFGKRVCSTSHPGGVTFFDPDNGIEVASVRTGTPRSRKYVFWSELARAFGGGNTVVTYQHFPRVAREPYLRDRLQRLAKETRAHEVLAVHGSHVAYLIALRDEAHRWHVEEALADLGERWTPRLTVVRQQFA